MRDSYPCLDDSAAAGLPDEHGVSKVDVAGLLAGPAGGGGGGPPRRRTCVVDTVVSEITLIRPSGRRKTLYRRAPHQVNPPLACAAAGDRSRFSALRDVLCCRSFAAGRRGGGREEDKGEGKGVFDPIDSGDDDDDDDDGGDGGDGLDPSTSPPACVRLSFAVPVAAVLREGLTAERP
ncbi:MAG: hypothetical protein BJ554DRAFT_7970, partial [Olpidium bornovanus]